MEGDVLDILPNYYYDIQILDAPRTVGYATQEEAAKNPVSAEEDWYVIHDHAPVIFNMVSDGQRELGVSHILRNPNTAENTTAEFFIKVYSKKYPSEENKSDINISFDDSYLTVDGIEEVTGKDAGIYGVESGDDTKGKVYKVTVKFNKTNNTGLLTSTCTVSWKGLMREIPVEWDRTFDPTQLFESVKLTIKGGENDVEIPDYFAFIHGVYDDNGKEITAPSVWGASADENNGEARNLGLHFPLQYGEVGSEYTYEYEIELGDLGEGKEYTWNYEIKGDVAIAGKVQLEAENSYTLTGFGPKFKLTRSGEGWEYGVGELVINVGDASYSIDLYHTGFFHKDYLEEKEKGIGLAPNYVPDAGREYTYYEVVSMGDTHWLDRNLGAHSADMYVKASTGTTYYGNPDAAGGYYRVGKYVKHDKPDLKDAENLICPPGYDIPTKTNYNSLRASSNFYTGLVDSYYTAAYSADLYDSGAKRKVVYFPKSLYLDAENKLVGESRAGYYWTRTAASGSEKEEIGAWLMVFNLSGEATSFVNGEVYCSRESTSGNSTRTGEINGYAMPVRCVSRSDVETTPEATSFFVSGATHVYLYTIEGNAKTAVTSWPGISIGMYNTVSGNFNFLYESSVNTPDKLYVIFNYVDKNGKILSLSRNAGENPDLKRARYSDNVSPNDLTGWKVTGDDAPAWSNYGNATIKTRIMESGGDTGCYWHCDFTNKKAGFGTRMEWDGSSYRIYVLKHEWYEGKEHNALNTWWDTGSPGGYPARGTFNCEWFREVKVGNDTYYYCDFTNPNPSFSFYYQIVYGASWNENGFTGGTFKSANDDQGTYVKSTQFEEADCEGKLRRCFTIRGWANDVNYGGKP